ncbi:MAG: hypothetical protein AAFQ13_07140, partial [Pseudomonadota bacterium]
MKTKSLLILGASLGALAALPGQSQTSNDAALEAQCRATEVTMPESCPCTIVKAREVGVSDAELASLFKDDGHSEPVDQGKYGQFWQVKSKCIADSMMASLGVSQSNPLPGVPPHMRPQMPGASQTPPPPPPALVTPPSVAFKPPPPALVTPPSVVLAPPPPPPALVTPPSVALAPPPPPPALVTPPSVQMTQSPATASAANDYSQPGQRTLGDIQAMIEQLADTAWEYTDDEGEKHRYDFFAEGNLAVYRNTRNKYIGDFAQVFRMFPRDTEYGAIIGARYVDSGGYGDLPINSLSKDHDTVRKRVDR